MIAGCVGAGPVTTRTTKNDISSPTFPKYFCPAKEVGHFLKCDENKVPSSQDFHKMWGEPKSYVISRGKGLMRYNGDLAWRGLVIFVIIPIPLLLPVGHNEITLDFENDKLAGINSEFGYGNYAICGLHSEGPNGFGCVMWH